MTLDIRDLPATLEAVIVGGDLRKLTPSERVDYYNYVCQSLGLNPLTRPFSYIEINGKLILYANRDATEQLRKLHGVNIYITNRERVDDVYIVSARATLPTGRIDQSIGAVSLEGLKGDNLANAFMKAETKAKRRVTLSIVGLGWLDESEIETIPGARHVGNTERGALQEGGRGDDEWETPGEAAVIDSTAREIPREAAKTPEEPRDGILADILAQIEGATSLKELPSKIPSDLSPEAIKRVNQAHTIATKRLRG